MTAPAQPVVRFRILLALTFVSLCCSRSLYGQNSLPECSLSKTNKSCELVIDRSNPVAPSTVQMYSDQQLTVIVKNPLPFERYFLDYSTGQATLAPDVASSIIQGLIPALGKVSFGQLSAKALAAGDPCDTTRTISQTLASAMNPQGTLEAQLPAFR